MGESNEVNVIFNPLINSSIAATNVSSNCVADGAADLTISGGAAPFTFFWSTASNSEDIGPLGPGTYSVTITDFNGCVATDQVTITAPPTLGLSASGTDITCNSASNGSISLSASGGNAPYTFIWSNGSTDQNQTGLAAGTLSVTMTDATSCTMSTSATINEPVVLKGTITGADVTATSGSNGSATLLVTGGVPPFSYAWSSGETTQDLNGITAGVYSVVVTDANGCQSSDTVEIMEPICATPLNPFTAFVTSNSARLNWLPVVGAHHYRIRGRKVGNLGWVTLHIGYTNPTFKNVFGLANNTDFEWQIRAFCDAGDSVYSAWSALDTCQTGCFAPELTFEAVVSAGAASLNWSRVFGASGYEVKGKPVGTLVAQTILVAPSDTFKHLFALNSNTQYEWRVRTWCDSLGVRKSDFTPFNYFTTTGASRFDESFNEQDPSMKFDFQAYPNPVSDVMNLKVNSSSNGKARIELITLDGRQLINDQLLLVEGEQFLEFSVIDFPAGIYQLNIHSEFSTENQRIVIMK